MPCVQANAALAQLGAERDAVQDRPTADRGVDPTRSISSVNRWVSRKVPARLYLGVLLTSATFGAAHAVGTATVDARGSVYYTDYDTGPRIRPVILDGSPTVRAGPFRRWRGWGSSKATATVRYGSLHTTVVMGDIRRCRDRRQYRVLVIHSYDSGRQLGRPKRYINRACRRR
jgi:hypothetical protein